MTNKAYLMMLCFTVPAIAGYAQQAPAPAAAVQAAPDTDNAPMVGKGYYWGGQRDFTITFPEPMVAEEEVGKEVKPCDAGGQGGFYRTEGDLGFTVRWVSTSAMEATPTADGPRTVSRFIIPEGLVSRNGHKMQGLSVPVSTAPSVSIENSMYPGMYNEVFFMQIENVAAMEAAIPGAYFLVTGRGDEPTEGWPRIPAEVHPATFGDALANWKVFRSVFWGGEFNDDDKEFMQAQPAGTVLPGMWYVKFPALPDPDAHVTLYLPGAGSFDRTLGCYNDREVATFGLPDFNAELTNKRTGTGTYAVELALNQAVAGDPAQFFRNCTWELHNGDTEQGYVPMEWDEARQAFVGRCKESGEVTLRMDADATAALVRDYDKVDGTKVHGFRGLRLIAKTDDPGVLIRMNDNITSIHGKQWNGMEDRERVYYHSMSTRLTPTPPIIYTDITANGMRGEGKRLVHCLAENVENLRVRVYRLESKGGAVPRTLRAYAKLYPCSDIIDRPVKSFIETWSYPEHLPEENAKGVPGFLLPGDPEMAEASLTLDANNECELDPSALFPGKDPHATYFVEFEGDVAREQGPGKRVLNQGVVQVTDLGLMWKLSAGRIFAYIYHLSDGKQVSAATLVMMDENGRELGRMDVKDGIALGDMPKEVRFLQVQSGTDCYTTQVSGIYDQMANATSYSELEYLWNGVNPAEVMVLHSCIFTDRELYRKGETAHVKGVLRFLQGNTLSIPQVEGIHATVKFTGGETKEFDVPCDADGTFCLDIPIDDTWYDYGRITFDIVYKGDGDGSAQDTLAALAANGGVPLEKNEWEVLKENRKLSCPLIVQDFRRNEFEVTSSLSVNTEEGTVSITAGATDFNTAPVSYGHVEWSVCAQRINFFPEDFKEYRFGDQIDDPYGYYSAYYGSGYTSPIEHRYVNAAGALDAEGKGATELTLPEFSRPGRARVSSTVSVTNGNEQTLTSVRHTTVESSAVYAGIRGTDKLARVGEPLKLDAILVTPEGKAYEGAPLPATVTVTRTVFHPWRYGSKLRSSIRNEKVEEEYPAREIMLSGTPAGFEVPTTSAGIYDITIQGQDAAGKPYYTAVRKYVWGDDVSPWEYENGSELALTADKDVYHVGDVAKILVQTPVDAELLVTVERDGVQHHFTSTVTVKEPVLEIPVEADFAPYIRVSVFLVQGGDDRPKSGTPVIKNAFIDLMVDQPEKRLNITFDNPGGIYTPTDECSLCGTVTDADGKPVAGAALTLYAEDEGTLQVMGYTTPTPYNAFYSNRLIGVATFDTVGQILGSFDHHYDYGNKGVFIGGGDESTGASGDTDPTADRGPRKDFNPCALWLGRVVTDGQGRFTATYTNPDTMTRYRVIAVANEGADRFGSGQSSYIVAKPVMLEPSAPLGATEGDVLDVPVTVTMLPGLLPEGAPGKVEWNVSLRGENAGTPDVPQTVTLNGTVPVTIHFPVAMQATGPVELTWTATPADDSLAGDARLQDAVQLSFDVTPATPHLRLPMLKTLKPGETVQPAALLKEKLRPGSDVELKVSVSPLSGAAMGVDYLFHYPYGCAEQLSSTLTPWLVRGTLKDWVEVDFPDGYDPEQVERTTVNKLLARQLPDGSFAYWEGDREASGFTPYVCFVLSHSAYAMTRPEIKGKAADHLRSVLERDVDADLLGLLALSRIDAGKAWPLFRYVRAKRKTWTLEDRILFACAAAECQPWMEEHMAHLAPSFGKMGQAAVKEAADAIKAAHKAGRKPNPHAYYTPPMETLIAYFNIKCQPMDLVEATPAFVEFVNNSMARTGYFTTWNNAWLCITIDAFCQVYAKTVEAGVCEANGQAIGLGAPLRFKGKLADTPAITVRGDIPTYLSGTATGYTVEPQKTAAVDKGFRVERHYEKLMPDGTWTPTAVFEVGDVVRVTFTAIVTADNPGAYLVAEDRLPAGFEAVNPMLGTQGLPAGVRDNQDSCWYHPYYINHTEYYKDRVIFFASSFGGSKGHEMKASYIARVVKSGRMTAPASKVEMMYTPGVYGLSIPQEFTVKPRSK